jgi:hypothetical protein
VEPGSTILLGTIMFQSRRPPGARYRDLRNRLRRLEAIYDDSIKLDRVIATGRYYKLAVATARAYEQIEKEFSWQKMFGHAAGEPPPAAAPLGGLDKRGKN